MKVLSTILLSSAMISGCGSDTTSHVAGKDATSSKRVAYSIKGELESVRASAASKGALGLWTDVTLRFVIDCTSRFELFSSNVKHTDEGVVVYASATASANKRVSQIRCQAFSYHDEVVTIPGILTRDDIDIVWLEGGHAEIPAETDGFETINDLKVTNVAPLCPKDMVCITDGVIVTVSAHLLGCVDKLGPVAYAADQEYNNGKHSPLKLAVSAVNFSDDRSQVARCAAKSNIQSTEIHLPLFFADSVDDIELTVVR